MWPQVWAVEFTVSAILELGAVRAFDRRRIYDAIMKQLTEAPATHTKNRKMLSADEEDGSATSPRPPLWELRVGDYRVSYDIDERTATVVVRAVRHKGRQQTGAIL